MLNNPCRILERTSALVLELLQREEELKKAKTEVRRNDCKIYLLSNILYDRPLKLPRVNNV